MFNIKKSEIVIVGISVFWWIMIAVITDNYHIPEMMFMFGSLLYFSIAIAFGISYHYLDSLKEIPPHSELVRTTMILNGFALAALPGIVKQFEQGTPQFLIYLFLMFPILSIFFFLISYLNGRKREYKFGLFLLITFLCLVISFFIILMGMILLK